MIFIHRRLRSVRYRIALACALMAVSGAVIVHHNVPMDMHAMPDAAICLAIIGGAAAAVAIRLATLRRPRLTPGLLWVPHTPPVARLMSAPVRAGPLFIRLQVLRR